MQYARDALRAPLFIHVMYYVIPSRAYHKMEEVAFSLCAEGEHIPPFAAFLPKPPGDDSRAKSAAMALSLFRLCFLLQFGASG